MNRKSDVCIYECPATMYVEASKKWVTGIFFVSPGGIYFECNPSDRGRGNLTGISIDFEEMSVILKESSTWIFPSITIIVGNNKHWFSSFSNRDSVFALITHFHKEKLLFPSGRNKASIEDGESSREKSDLGREMLYLAQDSQRTLSDAARTLERQASQLDDAMKTAEDVNAELTVADKLLTRLESWLGGPFAKKGGKMEMVVIPDRKRCRHIEVMYQKFVGNTKTKLQPGKFFVGENFLQIVDIKDNTVYEFCNPELSIQLCVLTPWEITISQKEFEMKIMTAYLTSIEPQLRRHFRKQMKYYGADWTAARRLRPYAENLQTNNEGQSSDCQIADRKIASVTDNELRELLQTVSSMKGLALDIGQELNTQMETIGQTSTAVDKAQINIKEDIRRMKELM